MCVSSQLLTQTTKKTLSENSQLSKYRFITKSLIHEHICFCILNNYFLKYDENPNDEKDENKKNENL